MSWTMYPLKRKLDAYLQDRPSAVAVLAREYIRSYSARQKESTHPAHESDQLPYWLHFPAWLSEVFFPHEGKVSQKKQFLDDVYWSQFCIFLSIRMKDDVYDQQFDKPEIIFPADLFLAESIKTLTKHFPPTEQFWITFTECLESTIGAIINVDKSQQSSITSFESMCKDHAKVSAVFKIGSAAVCLKAQRWRDYDSISKSADALAIAGQLLDDLMDIEEDLNRGRINAAALFLLDESSGQGDHSGDILEVIGQNLVYSNRLSLLFQEISTRIDSAQETLKCLKMSKSDAYFKSYRDSITTLQDNLHNERVRQVFGISGLDIGNSSR